MWSPQQEHALKAVGAWLKDEHGPQVFYLAGFAGTGKTTLAKTLAESVDGNVIYGAFTGKAALVLRRKGCAGASTIHSMIYLPRRAAGGATDWLLNENSPVGRAQLVIIDECSMVGEDLGRDLLSFGTRILVLGDPAQLPPVRGEGFFTARKPDVMLTEVHRQAQDNPIIRMSMAVREGKQIPYGTYGESRVIPRAFQKDVMSSDQVLVGMNRSRRDYNQRIRRLMGFEGAMPVVGERLVCLRNKHSAGLLNGGLWNVGALLETKPRDVRLRMMLEPEDAGDQLSPAEVYVHPKFFLGSEGELSLAEKKKSDQFDFGYALTVHKSQGSQWNSVFLFDEGGAFDDYAKWLYTGITRAAEAVTIVRAA